MINKTISRRSFGKLVGAGAALLAAPSLLRAQSFPSQTINVVVPLATGGLLDQIGRALSQPLADELAKRLVIVNRPGAGTQLGNTYFLQQPNDGHTILCTTLPPLILTKVGGTAPYELNDFSPINIQSRDFAMAVTSPSRGIESMEQVIERLKTDPSGISIGLQPSSVDLVNLRLMLKAMHIDSSKLRLVTYDGAGPVRNAVLGGHVDVGIVGLDGFITLKERIVPLMVFAEKRSTQFPETRSIVEFAAEHNFTPTYVDGAQRGWVVQSSMKKDHPENYERLVQAFEKVSSDPKVKESLALQQLEMDWIGPDASQKLYEQTISSLTEHSELLKG